MTLHVIYDVRPSMISKVDRIWGFDRYLVVCVIISLLCFNQNIRWADNKTTVVFQQPRPGPKLPKGENYFTIGWKQVCSRNLLASLSLILR